jgi:hypothetical protein
MLRAVTGQIGSEGTEAMLCISATLVNGCRAAGLNRMGSTLTVEKGSSGRTTRGKARLNMLISPIRGPSQGSIHCMLEVEKNAVIHFWSAQYSNAIISRYCRYMDTSIDKEPITRQHRDAGMRYHELSSMTRTRTRTRRMWVIGCTQERS